MERQHHRRFMVLGLNFQDNIPVHRLQPTTEIPGNGLLGILAYSHVLKIQSSSEDLNLRPLDYRWTVCHSYMLLNRDLLLGCCV